MDLFRRAFLRRLTFASSAAALSVEAAPRERKSLCWHVSGFSCVTCATGLETILKRKAGVLAVEASYPQASVHLAYDPAKISERELRDAIVQMGFRVEPGK